MRNWSTRHCRCSRKRRPLIIGNGQIRCFLLQSRRFGVRIRQGSRSLTKMLESLYEPTRSIQENLSDLGYPTNDRFADLGQLSNDAAAGGLVETLAVNAGNVSCSLNPGNVFD